MSARLFHYQFQTNIDSFKKYLRYKRWLIELGGISGGIWVNNYNDVNPNQRIENDVKHNPPVNPSNEKDPESMNDVENQFLPHDKIKDINENNNRTFRGLFS